MRYTLCGLHDIRKHCIMGQYSQYVDTNFKTKQDTQHNRT